jgi:hypothetical protein
MKICKLRLWKVVSTGPRVQYYKTFYGHNWQMFLISYGVCRWQVFQPSVMFRVKTQQNDTIEWYSAELYKLLISYVRMFKPGNTNRRGRVSTVELPPPTCLVMLLRIDKTFLTFYTKWFSLERRPIVLNLPDSFCIPCLEYWYKKKKHYKWTFYF